MCGWKDAKDRREPETRRRRVGWSGSRRPGLGPLMARNVDGPEAGASMVRVMANVKARARKWHATRESEPEAPV